MSKYELTNQTYLSQIYFDDAKLAAFALDEFARCLRTGRLTAFVGSMATAGLGYPDWQGLLKMAGEAVKKVAAKAGRRDVADAFDKDLWGWLERELKTNPAFDGRVAASVIGYWIDQRLNIRDTGARTNEIIAELLSSASGETIPLADDENRILVNLVERLKIHRFVTLNYDMEIELALREIAEPQVSKRYRRLSQWIEQSAQDEDSRGEHLRLTLDDGNVLASDAFSRERLDRLVEFAIGAADVDFHVLHLHGRVDRPESMVISYRDYDRLYRKESASKLPFDQALTMLHSTNPVLFVGLGMREPEVNRALEELVGNQPFKGIGRRFLLWSTPEPRHGREPVRTRDGTDFRWYLDRGAKNPVVGVEKAKEAFRLEKLHKLGVLTIFEDELEKYREADEEPPADPAARKRANLALAIEGLANFAYEKRAKRLEKISDWAWRRVDYCQPPNAPIRFTWHFDRSLSLSEVFGPSAAFRRTDAVLTEIAEDRPLEGMPLIVKTSRPGTQKGDAATALALAWAYRPAGGGGVDAKPGHRVLFINTSLRLDTDSILESLFLFLRQESGLNDKLPRPSDDTEPDRPSEARSREYGFRTKPEIFTPVEGKNPLIVMKGLERLFGKSGQPLSAEIDSFFRCYLHAALKAKDEGARMCPIVVFGTRRMRVYFSELEKQVLARLEEMAAKKVRDGAAPVDPPDAGDDADRTNPIIKVAGDDADRTNPIIKVEHDESEPRGYLMNLRKQYDLPKEDDGGDAAPLARDRRFARETYRDVFRSNRFRKNFRPGSRNERLAFAVLTILAFVGQPVEAEVLYHAPRIREELVQIRGESPSRSEIKRRKALDVTIKKLIKGGLVHDVRRPGFKPKSRAERKAQAEARKFYMRRYALHLSLQAEMRERYGVPLSEAVLSTSFNMSLYASQPADAAVPEPHVHDELGKLIDWFVGVQRDLFAYDPAHEYSGSASEPEYRARPHVAAALRAALAIVRGFYSTSALLSLDIGDRPEDERRDGALTEHADRIERIITAFGRLADERAARAAAEKTRGKNDEEIDKILGPGPIYTDELVWLHNERGVVKLTQGDLYEARFSFDQAERINREYVEVKCHSHNWRRIWLNQVVLDIERGKLAEAEDRIGRIENSYGLKGHVELIRERFGNAKTGITPQLPFEISHEDCLAAALATGYRGLLTHLRGEMHAASSLYKLAIRMLENLDEQRACALFRRHHASLILVTENEVKSARMAKLAIAGAESVQQMDIVHSARIMRHQEHIMSDKADDRKKAMVSFSKALTFAEQTDIHRVAIEARRNLATLKLNNGDLESALDHASIAMALAGRYGMTLFKVSLRILLARILHARGAEDSANALIRNAIVQANRLGYQRAVEAAQFALPGLLK